MTAPLAEASADTSGPPRDHLGTSNPIRVALLGLGQVGAAVARLAGHTPGRRIEVTGALVRRPAGRNGWPFPLVADPRALLDGRPDVVIEVLGGVEPARSIVLAALERGIPVVTANKSLLARCADELFAAAASSGAPLRYEAAVIPGVPFLCAFAHRPLASRITRLSAILNGTSNFIVSRLSRGSSFEDALGLARERGYAEPDATRDLDGTDAAEKLVILVRQFARVGVRPDRLTRTGIDCLDTQDLHCAAAFGGAIRPVACADWTSAFSAWVGPAFVPEAHPLSRVDGVSNAICLDSPTASAPLVFAGPGAGPEVTAATILDDVLSTGQTKGFVRSTHVITTPPTQHAPARWFVRFRDIGLRFDTRDVSELLSAHDVWIDRWSVEGQPGGDRSRRALTLPCDQRGLDAGLGAVRAATGCNVFAIRALEAPCG
jgi:homoserine dehydrogenase